MRGGEAGRGASPIWEGGACWARLIPKGGTGCAHHVRQAEKRDPYVCDRVDAEPPRLRKRGKRSMSAPAKRDTVG
jgi:hypothetical protein